MTLTIFLPLILASALSYLLAKALVDGWGRPKVLFAYLGAIALVLFLPAIAHAGTSAQPVVTGGDPSDWRTWVYTTVIAPFAVQAWRWLTAHVGVKKASEALHLEQIWNAVGDDAIDFAEELSHRATKEVGHALSGAAKHSKAIAAALEYAKRRGIKIPKAWQAKAQEFIEDLITRRLGARRGTAAKAG